MGDEAVTSRRRNCLWVTLVSPMVQRGLLDWSSNSHTAKLRRKYPTAGSRELQALCGHGLA